MKIITICNQKGGSGKSTTTLLLTIALASTGRRVLAIDLDPQAGLTSFLTDTPATLGTFDLLMGTIITPRPADRGGILFDFIGADFRLDKIYSTTDVFALKRALPKISGGVYDIIIMDTPPTMQGICRAALMVSDKIIIPADVSQQTPGPTLYTLECIREIEKTGAVYLLGTAPKEGARGFMADLTRGFIERLGDAFAGYIPRSISMQKAAADPAHRWTQNKRETILDPLVEAAL